MLLKKILKTLIKILIKTSSHLFLPPLTKQKKTDNIGRLIVSYGDFSKDSQQHLVLDAYTLLPKRIRKKHPLFMVGNCLDQDYLDRLHIHSYQQHVTIVPTPNEDLLQQAHFIIRMGTQTPHSPFDRKIIESRRIVLYSEHSNRQWIFPNGVACSSANIHDIAKEMKRLLHSPFALNEQILCNRIKVYEREMQNSWSQYASTS